MFAKLSKFAGNKVFQVKRHLLGSRTEAVLMNVRNGKILVDPDDRIFLHFLEVNGEHEWSEIEMIGSYLTANDDLLVVGAHLGLTVIPLAPRCRSVTAIEASPKNFQLFEWNLAINGIRNVKALNIAASDKRERLQFVMSRDNSGGSKRMPAVHDARYFADSPQIASVDAVPLDEVLPTLSPKVILMDIEGSEYFAIRGMQRLLSRARILAMEFLPHHLRNVSGVTVEELLQHLPGFAQLIIPSKNLTVDASQFHAVLQAMYERDEGDEGIIFLKNRDEGRSSA